MRGVDAAVDDSDAHATPGRNKMRKPKQPRHLAIIANFGASPRHTTPDTRQRHADRAPPVEPRRVTFEHPHTAVARSLTGQRVLVKRDAARRNEVERRASRPPTANASQVSRSTIRANAR
jgi:hypothetical protein